MERLVPGRHEPLHRRIFGCDFTYDDINFLQCKGYSFEPLPNPDDFHEKHNDINYWKAQLAFRGASSVSGNIIQLVERCINAELPDSMHPTVALAGNKLSREWVRLTWGEDEFEDDYEDDENDENDENDGWNEEDYDGHNEEGGNSRYENYDEHDEFEDMEEDGADNAIEAVFNGVNVINGGGNWQVTYYSYQT
ncbi:hypothetical protein EYC80_000894 [Monilinia laxa]|uniref:Uncharacterized protein n=1 Tax=Monilinia laxa TaxID=61186 RepID=A0A5N6K7F3_MONLA|nr:hypothetical protein EYC80_000894 [Monilinia laxa]